MSFTNIAFFVLLTKYKVVCPECEESSAHAAGIMPHSVASAPMTNHVVNTAMRNCGKTFCAPCRNKMREVRVGLRDVTDPNTGYQLFQRISGKEYVEPVNTCKCMDCEQCADFARWYLFHQMDWVQPYIEW